MPSKKKPVDEARSRLRNKLQEVQSKSKHLHDFIDNISNEAILHAENSLKETSKSKFLNSYSKASQQLESCLNKLLLLTDAMETMDESDEEGDEDEDEEDDADENDNETFVSTTTATNLTHATTVATELTVNNDTLVSIQPSVTSTSTTTLEKETSFDVRKRTNSHDSLFSSVSMQCESTPKTIKSPVALSKVIVEKYKWETGVAYPVLVTNFISPWEFYVQLVNPENDVMEKMCITFMKEATHGYKGGIDVMPSAGSYCCAKYTDGTWYRAQILDVYNNNSFNDVTVKVYFIDEGFFSVVGLNHLRPLDSKYASMLPSQSFHCILGGLQPLGAIKEKKMLSFESCSQLWTTESISWFQQKMDLGCFVAYFYYPPKTAYSSPNCLEKDILVCDLFRHSQDNECKLWQFSYNRPPLETHLGFDMIIQKMAAHCAYFESDLNRKKSQRTIKEILDKDTASARPELQNQAAAYIPDERPKKHSHHLPQATASKKGQKPVPSNDQKEKRHSKDTKVGNTEVPKHSPPTKDHRKGKKNKRSSKHSSSSDNNSTTSNEDRNTNQLDTTPMQIEFLPDVKNVSKVEKTNRTSSPILKTPPPATVEEVASNIIAIEEATPFEFCQIYQEITLSINRDTFVKVLVSEVLNPGLFYVHLVSPEVAKLDDMMEKINTFYDVKASEIRASSVPFTYEEGVAVVARYPVDHRWYRGLIVSKCEDDDTSESYNILYVDFGSSAVASKDEILPACKEFCVLPMETIPCCLADVEPLSPLISSERSGPKIVPAGDESSDDDVCGILLSEIKKTSPRSSLNGLSRWSEKSILVFKEAVLNQLPLLAALKAPEKNLNGLYEIYLYDTANDHDVFVNQYLVDEGVVTSKVFSKKTPTVQISELELEERIQNEGGMALWNPMKEQFFSKRNAYSVDVNDPAVAMLGYVEKERNICHQYLRGRCYRGSDCRFDHVKPGETPIDYQEVFCTDEIIQLPGLGDWVPVTITALLHPSHFWVNFPCGVKMFSEERRAKDFDGKDNPLICLNETMNEFYSHLKRDDKTDLTILAEGELVAAKYQDGWYRARVVNTAEDLVQVFFVDYGNTMVVTEDDIRKLIADFLHLPLQAVECYLNGIDVEEGLKENNLILYSELRLKFQEFTTDKLLMALVVSRSPRKDLVLEVYDTSTIPHAHINELVATWKGMSKTKKVSNIMRTDKKKVNMFPG